MSSNVIIDGLIFYLGLIVLLTFHEYGHAWMASKCGDDTAKDLGRCSLNPIVHIDPIGTVLIPLAAIFLSMSQTGKAITPFLIGWAKPVPVNANNLRNPKLDDILISMAGPWMNLLLAVVLMGLARLGLAANLGAMTELCMVTAYISLLLCFFNLIPIPPLDGSHVLRVVTGMSRETYLQFARFGFIAVIILLQIPFVRAGLSMVTVTSWKIIGGWFGITA
jgi:Zn-dependent protease